MNNREILYLLIAIISLIVAGVVILHTRRREKRLLCHLDEMLAQAIANQFKVNTYDESYLSAIEAKFQHYLNSCVVNNQELALEKEKIKALISDISHQTKTPIANIVLYTQLLQERIIEKSDLECKEMVEALHMQSEKLSFLIAALIKSSRLETDCMAVHPQHEAINDLLQSIAETACKKAEQKQITLMIPKVNEKAYFDLKWTSEALYNILDNAVKYSPQETTIKVEVKAYELFTCVQVIDEGPGILPEEFSKIFQRFYRGQRNQQEEGTGIGLYLAREIITKQNGYIKVESNPGKGSCFSIFLPNKK